MKKSGVAFAILATLSFCWLAFLPAPLCAQGLAMTTQELTQQAEVVAVGTVASMKSEWSADRTRISTRVTIAVREYLKGGVTEQQLTILTPGGEIGEVGEFYSGAARFQQEEEVMVFVKGQPGREMHLAGGALGKITITQDKTTGVMMVGLGMKLDDLRSQVKSAIQAPAPEEK